MGGGGTKSSFGLGFARKKEMLGSVEFGIQNSQGSFISTIFST